MINVRSVPKIHDGVPSAPDDLEAEFATFHSDILREVKSLRGFLSAGDKELASTAARSAQGETVARRLARDAYLLGDPTGYRDLTKLAQSEGRSKSSALASLALAGDRRGTSQAARRRLAVDNDPEDQWADL